MKFSRRRRCCGARPLSRFSVRYVEYLPSALVAAGPPRDAPARSEFQSAVLDADCATNTAATTRERRAHSSAGRAGVLSGAIERARSGRQRHARWRRGRLDAEVATCVGVLPPIRASARVEQHEQDASVGRVETDLGRPTGRVPASELSCVHRGGITGRFCHGSIACCLVAPGIRAAGLRSNRSSYPPSAAREHEPCDGKDERPIAHTKELPLGAACVKEASTS